MHTHTHTHTHKHTHTHTPPASRHTLSSGAHRGKGGAAVPPRMPSTWNCIPICIFIFRHHFWQTSSPQQGWQTATIIAIGRKKTKHCLIYIFSINHNCLRRRDTSDAVTVPLQKKSGRKNLFGVQHSHLVTKLVENATRHSNRCMSTIFTKGNRQSVTK